MNLSDLVGLAAQAMVRASGRSIQLEDAEALSNDKRRNLVARAVVRDDGKISRSVILKATRSASYDPVREDALETSGLLREWIATSYLASVAPDREHGAALIAGDLAHGILVFEDLGNELPSLVRPLLNGSAAEAETALTSYAMALGRLHADTQGCLDSYHQSNQSVLGAGRTHRPIGWQVEDHAKVAVGALGHAPPASELAFLSARLRDPGPWLSLVHGDPCPDNVLLVDGRARLIDYEWAAPSHALLDGIYWRIGFPTCWCAGRTPLDVCARVEAIYRAELGRSVAAALDDAAYRTEVAYMTAIWLFRRLTSRLNRALENDDQWGIGSIRGRILSDLDFVVGTTEEVGVLPGIRRTARAWLGALQSRWPEAEPLGFFPAFTGV